GLEAASKLTFVLYCPDFAGEAAVACCEFCITFSFQCFVVVSDHYVPNRALALYDRANLLVVTRNRSQINLGLAVTNRGSELSLLVTPNALRLLDLVTLLAKDERCSFFGTRSGRNNAESSVR